MTRSAAVVGGGTLASRVLGLVRDMVLASVLGASMPADAFFAAFRLPNLLRRMFAEGSLTSAFVPVFTEVHANEGRGAAINLATVTLNWLLLVLLVISAGGIVVAPQIVTVLTPGWIQDPEKFSLTVSLTRIMFPYILLVSMMALAMGILNAQGHFAAPSIAPALLNISLIATALWASRFMEQPAYGVAFGVLLGGLAQVLLQMPPLWLRGFRYRWGLSPYNPHLRRVGRLFFPSLIGSGVYQVNMVIITILASLLPHGSLSYLYYADRLVQFPLGVFAIAVGTAALPAMSRHAAQGDIDGLHETLGYAFRQVSLIMIPAAIGLIVLREPIMNLLFQRGRFDPLATRMSAQALLGYSVGLWFVAEIRVVAPAFYALKDTLTPMMAATLAIVINVLLSLLLMGPLGHAGLALAISISSIFQLGVLLWKLGPRLGGIDWRGMLGSTPKVLAASGAMGLLCWIIVHGKNWTGAIPLVEKMGVLGGSILAGILFYGVSLHLLKVAELRDLLSAFVARLREGRS